MHVQQWGSPKIRDPFWGPQEEGLRYFGVYIGVPLLRETSKSFGPCMNILLDCAVSVCTTQPPWEREADLRSRAATFPIHGEHGVFGSNRRVQGGLHVQGCFVCRPVRSSIGTHTRYMIDTTVTMNCLSSNILFKSPPRNPLCDTAA